MNIETLLKALGRCVYYHAGLAKHLGGVNPALFFSQIHYWQGKTDSPLGVYKSSEVLMGETGMTYKEQMGARKRLVELGILIETHKRLEHRLYFKIDYDALQELLSANVQNANSPNDNLSVREETKQQPVNRYKEMTTEMIEKRAAKPRSTSGVKTLKTYLQECKDNQVKPISDEHPSRKFAAKAGIPGDILGLMWMWFKENYTTGTGANKKYADWGLVFNNAVKGNWGGLWYVDRNSGEVLLSNNGLLYKASVDADN